MTPTEIALRDAFLAECWKPVREHHQTKDERAAAWARTQVRPQHGDDTPEDEETREERAAC